MLRKTGSVLLILAASFLYGADSSIAADVSSPVVGVGEPFTLSVTVRNADGAPILPELPNFDNAGTSVSQNVEIVNGRMSQSLVYSYTLIAKMEGTFTIPEITLTSGGKTYRSQPITLTVSKDAPAKPKQKDPFEEFERMFRRGAPRVRAVTEKDIFVVTTVSKRDVYAGEAVFVTDELYTMPSVLDMGIERQGAHPGFWVEKITNQPLVPRPKTRGGVVYQTGIIRNELFFPIETGSHSIGSNDYVFLVSAGYNNQRVQRSGTAAVLTVRALPPAPMGYSGAVGSFDIRARVDTASVPRGTPFTLSVTVSGSGNAKTISLPDVRRMLPATTRVFTSRERQNNDISGQTIRGTKSADYVIIAEEEGGIVIPPLSLIYFDPSRGTYATAYTSEIKVRVAGGSGSAPSAARGEMNIRRVKPLKKTIAAQSGFLFLTPWPYLYFAALVLACALVILYKREAIRKLSDSAYRRSREANRTAHKRLAKARYVMNDDIAYYGELEKALTTYLSDVLGLNRGVLISEIEEALTRSGIAPDIVEKIRALTDAFSYARYSPEKRTKVKAKREHYRETEALISSLKDIL